MGDKNVNKDRDFPTNQESKKSSKLGEKMERLGRKMARKGDSLDNPKDSRR